MKSSELTDRTLTAAMWRFAGRLSMYPVRLLVVIVLARLLPPSDFGLVATALIFGDLATSLIRTGFSSGVIQEPYLETIHVRVAFTLAFGQGLFFGSLLWLLAPLMASFFEMPELLPVFRLLAIRPVIAAVGAISESILARRLDFRALTAVEIQSFLISHGLIGVSLALAGHRMWALAWAAVLQGVLRATLAYVRTKHSLRPSFAIARAGRIFSFGLAGLAARVASYGATSGDTLIVARFLGADATGFYRRAHHLVRAPTEPVSGVLRNVLFPAFSSIQSEPKRLTRAYCRSISLASMAGFPSLAFIAILAPELIRGLFGAAWTPTAPALQALAFGGVLRSIHWLGNSGLARAKGATSSRVVRDICHSSAVIAAALFGQQWGITGVALGVSAVALVPYLLTARIVHQLVGLGWRDFFRAQGHGLVLAALVALVAYSSAELLRSLPLKDLPILLVAGLAGPQRLYVSMARRLADLWRSANETFTTAPSSICCRSKRTCRFAR